MLSFVRTLPLILLAAAAAAAEMGAKPPAAADQPFPPKPDFYQAPDPASPSPVVHPAQARPNIILMIGDGMGANQVAVARRVVGGPHARLHIDRLPIVGLMLTHAVDRAVTDSAAAGTALSCAVKTRNGMVGMTPDQVNHLTILEGLRRRMGYRTGLVATSTITHATPAAFVAEVAARKSEEDIALQLVEEQVDVAFGGGRANFLPKDGGGKRVDGRDLVAQLRQAGCAVVLDLPGFTGLESMPVLGLFSAESMDSTDAQQPSLEAMTRKALGLLGAGGKPFFLMVEGSQIDWAGHNNDPSYLVRETLHFDLAVREACAFAAGRTDTIVVVTADHETGALSPGEDTMHWGSKGHSASPVPVYACGAGAAAFSGVMDNTELPKRLAAFAGLHLPEVE